MKHIQKYYGTSVVDLVISTHPDQDHINGLFAVIEQLDVKNLWIHKPWDEPYGLADLFDDGRVTDNSIGERLKVSLESAYKLVQLAEEKNIPVQQPFTGLSLGNVKVLGPTADYYKYLLKDLEGMPKAKKAEDSLFFEAFAGLEGFAKRAMEWIVSKWGEDKLDDNDTTSAKNNTSVITQILVDNKRLVFTGDAGITALDAAADQIDACVSGAELTFIQIPHHGSKRNVGPSVLDRLLGEPIAEGKTRSITAVASSAKQGEPKHAHKAVLNAFTHRGAKVLSTRGNGVCHYSGILGREGWSSRDAEPYHYEYEDEA